MKKIFILLFILVLPLLFNSTLLIKGNIDFFTIISTSWTRIPSRGLGLAKLTVRIAYYGNDTLSNIDIQFYSKNISVIGDDIVKIGIWQPGEIVTVEYVLNISKVPLNIDAWIIIRYYYKISRKSYGYDIKNVSGVKKLSITLKYYGSSSITIKNNQSYLYYNRQNNLTLLLINNGSSSIYDIYAKISIDGASIIGGKYPLNIYFKSLSPGETFLINLTLLPFSNIVKISIHLDYINIDGGKGAEERIITIPAYNVKHIKAVFNPNIIKAGKSRSVEFIIYNTADIDVNNAMLILKSGQIIVSPSFISIKNIPANSYRKIRLNITVPATLTTTQYIQYELTYQTESGTTITYTDTATLYIISSPEIIVTSIEVVPSNPKENDNIILSISLLNSGTSSVKNLNVSINLPEKLIPLRKTYLFMGQLQPQSPISIPFSFTASQKGIYIVTINITYTDVYGFSHKFSKKYTISVGEKLTENKVEISYNNYIQKLIFIISGFIVVIIFLFLFIWRRKK